MSKITMSPTFTSTMGTPGESIKTAHVRTFAEAKSLLYGAITKAGAALENASRRRTSTVDAMAAFVERLQLDMSGLSVIHVAGTKGKGSTCALVESVLRRHGFRTGLFTSPHLLEVTERVRLDGKPLAKDAFARYFFQVWDRLQTTAAQTASLLGCDINSVNAAGVQIADTPGYFHLMTLVGLWCFVQEKVDVCIVEVGMGGRYDATNVIPSPVACGVTTLDLDHTQVLGDTLEKIAWEKGGIFKEDSEAFTVEQSQGAMEVLLQCAKDAGCTMEVVPPLPMHDPDGVAYEIGLGGDHQRINAALALRLCLTWIEKARGRPTTQPVFNGSGSVVAASKSFMASVEVFRPPSHPWVTVYLDGAHTEQSMHACLKWFAGKTAAAAHTEHPRHASEPERRRRLRCRRVLWFNASHEREVVPLLDPLAKARSRGIEEVAVGRDDSHGQGGSTECGTITRTRAACACDDEGDGDDDHDRDDEPLFDEAWFVEVTPARPSRFTPATATEILTPHGLSTPIVADDPSKQSNTGNETLNAASDDCTVRDGSDEHARQQGAGQTEVQGHGVAGVWQRTLQQVWIALQARAGGSRSVTGTGTAPHLVEKLCTGLIGEASTGSGTGTSYKLIGRHSTVGGTDKMSLDDGVLPNEPSPTGGPAGLVRGDKGKGTETTEPAGYDDVNRVEVLCTGSLYVVAAVLEAFGAEVV